MQLCYKRSGTILSREKLAENLITFIPLLHKKLMKGFRADGIPKQQLWLLNDLSDNNGKTMSYYSEKMMIPKSNLTLIADKLIDGGLIERVFDPNDRRIIILKITEKGEKYLYKFKEKVVKEMEERLGLYSDNDIRRLNELIEEMKTIFEQKGK